MLRVDLITPVDGSDDILVELHLRLPPQVSSELAATIQPRLPPTCTLGAAEVTVERRSWRGRCVGGLPPGELALEGLGRGLEVVVDLRRGGGAATTAVLHGGAASVPLGAGSGSGAITEAGGSSSSGAAKASGYLGLGVEHIFAGLDHLCFVVGLVLLGLRPRAGDLQTAQLAAAGGRPPRWARLGHLLRVLGLLTAFTFAHSLTLAAAALGWLRLPSAPVEACIALSIVLLAREVVRTEPQIRSPWGFACACGLLHGLGFAGALAQIGLPSGSIVSALVLFNVGVELGQVAVALATLVGLGLALGLSAPRYGSSADRALRLVLGTALGSLAVAWTLERALSMVH